MASDEALTRPPDYVAFTGLTEEDQIEEGIRIFKEAGFNLGASHRGVFGIAVDPTGRYSGEPIYVPERNIPQLVHAARAAGSIGVGTCIHFNGKTLQVQEGEVLGFLDRLSEQDALPSIVQLNGHLPHPSVLEAIHKHFPPEETRDFRVAVQVRPDTDPALVGAATARALKKLYDSLADPAEVDIAARTLKMLYDGLVNCLNMNSSAGTGRRFKIQDRWRAFVALWKAFPAVAIGLPGGLSADNAQAVCTEIDAVLNDQAHDYSEEGPFAFSIDAEKRVQHLDGPHKGKLDMRLARGYVFGAAIAVVRGRTPSD